MSDIVTLEDLARRQEVDITEYGLKAEGQVILLHAMNHFREENSKKDSNLPLNINFQVDSSFIVPRSVTLDDTSKLRNIFFDMALTPTLFMHKTFDTTTYTRYSPLRVLLARSSDQDEQPGKLETHFSLWDPSNPEKSFNDWLLAARKVRDSGAGAVIGQPLIAQGRKPDSFQYQKPNQKLLEEVLRLNGIEQGINFGISNFSFIANTGNLISSTNHCIFSVVGLLTKIVKGEFDFDLFSVDDYQEIRLHTSNDYRHRSAITEKAFPQKTFDIINSNNVDNIYSIKYIPKLIPMRFSFGDGAFSFPSGSDIYNNFSHGEIFTLTHYLQKITGKHIEIEATWIENELFPHIFQLRKYDLPENRPTKLTLVPEEKIVQNQVQCYISDKFVGDLVYIIDSSKYNPNYVREKAGNNYILIDSLIQDETNHSVPYPTLDLDNFPDAKGIIYYLYLFDDMYQELRHCDHASHAYGYALSLVTKVQEKLPVIVMNFNSANFCDNVAYNRLKNRMEQYNNFTIIRDVTVESNGKHGQIYLN
ncbi:MAG: hypothetical protein ACMXYG_02310 [Candidatus Woesearchaeota archaeon]